MKFLKLTFLGLRLENSHYVGAWKSSCTKHNNITKHGDRFSRLFHSGR